MVLSCGCLVLEAGELTGSGRPGINKVCYAGCERLCGSSALCCSGPVLLISRRQKRAVRLTHSSAKIKPKSRYKIAPHFPCTQPGSGALYQYMEGNIIITINSNYTDDIMITLSSSN